MISFLIGTTAYLALNPRPDRGRPTLNGWWAPVALRYKERWRPAAHGTRFTCAPPNPPKTLARSEGAQEQREAAASAPLAFSPLQLTPSRRHRHRPRHRRPGVDLSASLVAALERISINEPEMAASSSTGGDGLYFSLPVYSMF